MMTWNFTVFRQCTPRLPRLTLLICQRSADFIDREQFSIAGDVNKMLLGTFVEQYDAMDKWRMEASSPTIASSTSSNGGPSTTLPPINTTILEKDEHLSTSPDHDETI